MNILDPYSGGLPTPVRSPFPLPTYHPGPVGPPVYGLPGIPGPRYPFTPSRRRRAAMLALAQFGHHPYF